MDAATRLPRPQPSRPGLLVRTLGNVVPGVRRTGEQIEAFAREWHDRNLVALASGLPVWVALGDSLAQGIGASSVDHGYVGRIANDVAGRLVVVNLSKSGAKIGDVLERQLGLLAGLGVEPLMITCTVGSNDLLRGASPTGPAKRMRELVAALPDVAVMGTLPDQGSVMARRLSGVVRKASAERGLAVADVSGEMSGWRGKTAPDGFHPNDAGYEAWVRAFAPIVHSRLS